MNYEDETTEHFYSIIVRNGWDSPDVTGNLINHFYLVIDPPDSLNTTYEFSWLRKTYWEIYLSFLAEYFPDKLREELETEERLKEVCEVYFTDIETLSCLLSSFWYDKSRLS